MKNEGRGNEKDEAREGALHLESKQTVGWGPHALKRLLMDACLTLTAMPCIPIIYEERSTRLACNFEIKVITLVALEGCITPYISNVKIVGNIFCCI